MKLTPPDILAEVVSIATNDGRALEPTSLDQFPALLTVGKQEFAAQLRLESDLVPGSTARVPIKFSDRLAAQPSFPVGTEFSIREPGYLGNGRVIEVYADAEKGSVPSSHISQNLGSAPPQRLSVIDRWIIVLVVGLVAVLLVIDHYQHQNSSPGEQVFLFVLFFVIYVWPTAIALGSSSLHGFFRYLFGLTAVPLFVALFFAWVHWLFSAVPAFGQGFSRANQSGNSRGEQGFAIIAIAPAAFVFWLWYKALTMIDRVIFRPKPNLVRPKIDMVNNPVGAMVAATVAMTKDGEFTTEKSWNPALTIGTFEGLEVADDAMTLLGTVNKTAILLAIVLIAALWAWSASSNQADLAQFIWIGGLGGFVVALATIFIKTISPYTSPIYAALEGLALGAISAEFEAIYPGIAIQSFGLTIGTLVVILILYRSGAIKVTQNFKAGIISATGAICLLYLVDIALMFSGKPISFIHQSGPYGILFSLFVVTIAALNLVIDFDFVAQGVANKCPKYMEWYSAFGLVVTLVWLYLKILRILAKLTKRN